MPFMASSGDCGLRYFVREIFDALCPYLAVVDDVDFDFVAEGSTCAPLLH